MYCNTIELYCEKRARQGWTVLQYSAQPSHDTATVAATRHAGAGLGAQVGMRGTQQARRRLGKRALGCTAQAGRAQAAGGRWAQARAASCSGARGAWGRRAAGR